MPRNPRSFRGPVVATNRAPGLPRRTFSPALGSALSTIRTPLRCACSSRNAARSARAISPASPSNNSGRSPWRSRTRAKWRYCPTAARHVDFPTPRYRPPVHRHRLFRLRCRPRPFGDRRTTSRYQALSTRHARLRRVHARPAHLRVPPDRMRRHGSGPALYGRPDILRAGSLDRAHHG